jgi:hypothetical protein
MQHKITNKIIINSCKYFLFTIIVFIIINCFLIKKVNAQNSIQTNKIQSLNSIENFNQDKKNYNHDLQIFNENNQALLKLAVAVADSDEKRHYGLMNLKKLDEKKGMIFIFQKPLKVDFWMKNTLISLDIIFIDAEDKILEIRPNTIPQSTDFISSKQKILKVLEINAGLVKKYNIKIGDKIIF